MGRLLLLLGLTVLSLVMVHAMEENSEEGKNKVEKKENGGKGAPYRPKPGQEYHPMKQCYQCGFTYPKTVIKELKVPRNITERVKVATPRGFHFKTIVKTVYDIHHVTETTQGGWEKCMGPFTHAEAESYGIDKWDCDGNCYTRLDMNGDLFRGCYSGAFGVDQQMIGCYEQGGSTWCFCEGDVCNTIYPGDLYGEEEY